MTTETLPMKARPEATAVEPAGESRSTFRPSVDICETPEELVLYLDLPGAISEQIDVQFEQGFLAIHAPVRRNGSEAGRQLRCEYGVGDFHREFRVGAAFDPQGITAEFQNGVLVVRLPKAPHARTHKVAVKTRES